VDHLLLLLVVVSGGGVDLLIMVFGDVLLAGLELDATVLELDQRRVTPDFTRKTECISYVRQDHLHTHD
jgi:hypothetical protein